MHHLTLLTLGLFFQILCLHFFFFRIRGQYLKIGKFHINIQTAGFYQNIEQFGKRATFHMAIISVPMQSTDTALTLSVSLPQVI